MIDWNACLAQAKLTSLTGVILRLVESQEQVATNQLVGSLERQAVLEALLETTKPRLRPGTENLHYLLATPFRYPPLKHGSRFATRSDPSLFYGSLKTGTVLAEAAYYRFLFWYGMVAPPAGKLDTQHTVFGARYRTEKGVQLQNPPFFSYGDVIGSPAEYGPSQALGSVMRNAGVEAFEFISARDPAQGVNVALFTPAALQDVTPVCQEPWLCELSGRNVRFHAAHSGEFFSFSIDTFLVSGKLPHAAA
ncbi:MAG TPA: RES family NAD+ phosphorylase [Burkholderiales bacterium]|nr:RES family NAD+ phosphorylase [Burkholderiales bacterium]